MSSPGPSPEGQKKSEPQIGLSVEKKTLLKKILRFLFSHVGLCFLNITYLLVGSVIFIQLESWQDAEADNKTQRQIQASQRIDLKRRELIDLVVDNAAYTNQSTIEGWLNDYQAQIGKEIQDNQYKTSITEEDFSPSDRWSFSSVMLFVLSIASTIGYGHIYPKSDGGYLLVTAYGLFGFPFFVMSMGSIGGGLAAALKVAYRRACCWAMTKRRARSHEPRPATGHAIQPAEDSSPDGQREDGVPLSLAIGTVILYTFFGGLLFSWKEQWDYIPSIYFCVVTLMTIGFGDYVPGWSATSNVTGQLSIAVAFLYIVVGLALVSMTLNVAVDLLRNRVTIMISKMKIWDEEEEVDYL